MTLVLTHGGCGCGCASSSKDDPDQLPLDFYAVVLDVEPGTDLRILNREGKEAWARKAPETPVCFANVEAKLSNETIRFTWNLEGNASDVWAQYSADQGKTWHGLTVGLCDGSAEVNITGVPAGQVLVRLLAHDGFSTAASKAVEIKVTERAPYPAILYPADGGIVAANTDIEVLGSAVDQGGFPIDEGCLEWVVDGVLVERRGRAVMLRVKEGSHKLALRALAQHNAEVTISVTARVIRV